MTMSKDWLTVPEAAERASVHIDMIYDACLRRELKHTKVGGRRLIRLKREWLDEWLERHARDVESRRTPAEIAKILVDLTKEKGR